MPVSSYPLRLGGMSGNARDVQWLIVCDGDQKLRLLTAEERAELGETDTASISSAVKRISWDTSYATTGSGRASAARASPSYSRKERGLTIRKRGSEVANRASLSPSPPTHAAERVEESVAEGSGGGEGFALGAADERRGAEDAADSMALFAEFVD